MDYLILGCSTALVFVILSVLYLLPKYAKEGIDLFLQENNIRDLKKVVFMSNFIKSLSFVIFFICSLIVCIVWKELQQNWVQKLSWWGFFVSAVLLLVFIVRMHAIGNKALKSIHTLCVNNIVEAIVEEQKKGLWICKFKLYHEELWGYLDEKPSFDMIESAVLKYDNRKKMYLLQEMH